VSGDACLCAAVVESLSRVGLELGKGLRCYLGAKSIRVRVCVRCAKRGHCSCSRNKPVIFRDSDLLDSTCRLLCLRCIKFHGCR
jgi:hypothetical protein